LPKLLKLLLKPHKTKPFLPPPLLWSRNKALKRLNYSPKKLQKMPTDSP
jgi:hypothetical protein